MTNKGISFFLSILLPISILTICPFSISADSTIVPTFSSGMQTKWNEYGGHITEYHESGTNINGISTLRFTFDNHYYGYFGFTYFFGNNSTYAYGEVFIADGYGEYNYRNASNGSTFYVTAVRIDYGSMVIPDSNVDLTQIIDLLTAIQGNTSNIVLQIEDVLDELIISNGYLEDMTKLRQWNIPIESFSYTYYFLQNMESTETINYNYYNFPLFYVTRETKIPVMRRSSDLSAEGIVIFGLSGNYWDKNSIVGSMYALYNFEVLSAEIINRLDIEPSFSIVKLRVKNTSTDNEALRYFTFKNPHYFFPIYINYPTYDRISTDFAIQYGLSNKLLDNIDKIANGTQQSSSAAGSNDSATNEFNDVAGDMYDYEDDFNGDMNQSLNQIDTNFNIGSSFGSNFSASAQWVSQQFNQLTSSTPFGSVLSFSLLLGLALLIVGKVLR